MAWQLDRVSAGVLPLETRRFERLTLVTLGTAGAAEDHNRRGTSIAAGVGEQILLVDAGRGLAEALRAAEIPVDQPLALLVTSLLPENTVGLDDWLAAAWLAGRREPLRVIGPPGIRAAAEAARASVAPGVVARARALGEDASPPALEISEVESDWSGSIGPMQLRAKALPGGPIPTLAWRIEANGKSAVIGGVGWGGEALQELARDAGILFHDAAYVPSAAEAREHDLDVTPERLAAEAAFFTEFDEAGNLARRTGVHALVLIRMRQPPVLDMQITSRIDDHFAGRIAVARDGDEFAP
jgi:ribonuclease BN (tRNA processing enzyme)